MASDANSPRELDAHRTAVASGAGGAGPLLPRSIRRTMLVVVGVVLAGAAYLSIVRGPAILLDLSGLAALLCG